jgi:serine O-acetyltransferase
LKQLVEALVGSYGSFSARQLPSQKDCVEVLELCFELLYPGYFRHRHLTQDNIAHYVGVTLEELRRKLERLVAECLSYAGGERCDTPGREKTAAFLQKLPEIRRLLLLDAEAAYQGDPAASSLDEVILCYPGQLAITVHRIAHELFLLEVPMMPRMMSEWAHARTGADIHPGAEIGESFFLDHATGAVIGGSARIGKRCRLYQGVTLGALSLPRQRAQLRSAKRHPTVEDDVTIYANAIVLGGETVIGKGSVIGGSVFLTSSIPPQHRVSLDPPRLRVLAPVRGTGPDGVFERGDVDFDI